MMKTKKQVIRKNLIWAVLASIYAILGLMIHMDFSALATSLAVAPPVILLVVLMRAFALSSWHE